MNRTVDNGMGNSGDVSQYRFFTDADVKTVQDLISRYVGQLLYGCGDSTCIEATCATGRRNTSNRPVRDYTPRSARAIAITLVSGPKPRCRLCQHYVAERSRDVPPPVEGPRDASAFIQQISDTSAIRTACDPDIAKDKPVGSAKGESAHDESFISRLNHWRAILDEYSESFANVGSKTSLSIILNDNVRIATTLCQCLRWLVSTLPELPREDWFWANLAVQGEHLCPPNLQSSYPGRRSSAVALLDALDDRATYSLFLRVLQLMSKRAALESDALRMEIQLGRPAEPNFPFRKLDVLIGSRLQLEISFKSLVWPLLIWPKKTFLDYWDDRIVLPRDSIATIALAFHEKFFEDEDPGGHGLWQLLPVIPARLDAMDVARSYLAMGDDDSDNVHILEFPSVFKIQELATYFRTINHVRMQKAHSTSQILGQLHERHARLLHHRTESERRIEWLQEHYLLLNISRQNVLQDAFNQIWQRRRSELFRPLRVRLGEMDELEVGHDLGGVQIEFFNLLCRELLKEEAGMFTTDANTALTYFRPGSLQPLYMFELAGMLFGLALYNGITLPINFPVALYSRLTPRGGLEPDISDRWPDVDRSLQSILDNDIPGLDAVVPLEANGLRLSILLDASEGPGSKDEDGRIPLLVGEATRIVHHQPSEASDSANPVVSVHSDVDIATIASSWPGWYLVSSVTSPPEITPSNKEAYVRLHKRWLAWYSVFPQLSAFTKGFHTLIPRHQTAFLTPVQLRTFLEGTQTFSIAALQQGTEYENYDPNSRYIRSFWRLVSSWPEKKQRQLLKFVTAIERMPAAGSGSFEFKIERPEPDDDKERLPKSSTCFRTLILPKYDSVEVLDKKLSVAFEFGLEGFGTG